LLALKSHLLTQVVVFVLLCLWAITFYSFTLYETLLKYCSLGFLLIYVLWFHFDQDAGFPSERPIQLLGLFWLWLVGKSIVQGVFESPYFYLQYFENAGFQSIVYVLEVFGLWGWLFLLILVGMSSQRKWLYPTIIFLPVCFGLIGSLGKYLIWGPGRIGEHLTIFSNQYSMSALLLNSLLFFALAWALNQHKDRLWRVLSGSLFLAGVVAVFLMRSRGGTLSLLLGIFLFLVFAIIRIPKQLSFR